MQTIKDTLKLALGITVWFVPIATLIYSWWLGIKLFLLPLFEIYGVLGFFGLWLGLTAVGYICGYFLSYLWIKTRTTS